MENRNTISAFVTYIFLGFLSFTAIFANRSFIYSYLISNDMITYVEFDEIQLYRVYGYILGAIVFMLSVRIFNLYKMLIASMLVYWLAIINILFVDVSYKITLLYFTLYSSCIIIYFLTIMGCILSEKKADISHYVFSYIIAIFTAYMFIELCKFTIKINDINYLLLKFTLIALASIVGCVYVLMKSSFDLYKFDLSEYNFSAVASHLELESVIGFVVFYIIMVISNGYELYALTDSLANMSSGSSRYIVLSSSVIIAMLAAIYLKNINKYLISFCLASMALILFVTLPFWGVYYAASIILWCLIGLSIYGVIICNIINLSEKFTGINLFCAISINATSSTFGYYCGYITFDSISSSLGENSFLIAICFALIGLVAYYLFLFKSRRLISFS